MQWPLVGREAVLDQAMRLVELGTGLAILGPAGVGKSRLLHELADRAEGKGKAVVRAVASESTRSIPFAPFVELIPEGLTQDLLSMFGAALKALQARAGQRGLLLSVDDAHHLDESSLAFLVSAVSSGVATVALTARTGEPMATDLVDLWTNGVIERRDIGPLDRDEARSLIQTTLGEISSELEAELWRLSRGNPLVLHELVEGAVGFSISQDEDDVWALTGSLAESPRLSDLVASRIRALPEELRPAMDIVALGSPLPLDLARQAMGDDLLALEERSLIDTTRGDVERTVVPAHPLHGEILEAHLGEVRRQAAYQRLVDAVLRLEKVSDPLRAALWQRDSGEVRSRDVALSGAHQALVRHEPGLAEELLRPLGTEDDHAALLLGRALSYQQRFDEAEQALTDRDPSNQELLSEIASIRAQNMAFGMGRVADGRALLEKAADRMEDADARARLINERAMVSAIHGDFVDAMSASERVLSDPKTSVVPRAAAYVTLSVALAMTGDCDRMDEIVDDAIGTAMRARDALPFARDQVGVMQMSSTLHAGRIPEASRLCDEALRQADRGNAARSTWLSASVMAHELAGRLRDGASTSETALDLFAEVDPFGLEAQARGLVALTRGQMGDPSGRRFLDLAAPIGSGPRLTIWRNRGRAWALAARGKLLNAAQVAAEEGREGVKGEHFAWAAFCFSDVVRFGRPDLIIESFRQIDTSKGAHLIDALKQHAEATLAADPEDLERVAGRFATFGAWLLAAEAYAQASALFESSEQGTNASRCVARSISAEYHCQEPDTPALRSRPALVSSREVEVAVDAAIGLTSPQISENRYISVRTVDNHLSSVYRKLDVTGRDELSEVLSPVLGNE